MLKIIAVQVTGLSNEGHDTGLAVIFGAKTRLKNRLCSVFVSIRFVSLTK